MDLSIITSPPATLKEKFEVKLNEYERRSEGMADKRFTSAEVKERGGRGGGATWVIYRDGVYDVTAYIAEHPGGDVILEEAGKDATAAFDDVGHSSDALDILKKYKIGEIVEEEKKYDANGKKKKRVVNVPADKPEGRSCISVVTCGLLG